MSHITIGGITIPIESIKDFNQRYEPLGATSILRMADGSGVEQTAWTGKLKVVTSGSGWVPTGLDALGKGEHLFKCGVHRAIQTASNVIVLPSARRTDADFIPLGFAVVDNKLVETDISISGDTATLTAVADATGYRVHYWPELTVFIRDVPESWQQSTNTHSWSFEAEEK